MGFQTQVNSQPAPGVEGAIASANTPALYVTGPGGLVSCSAGVTVGRFAWTNDGITVSNDSTLSTSKPANGEARVPQGFVANEQQGLNTTFLSASGMLIQAGQAMELFTRGDFWAKMKTAAATISPRLKAFANLFTGEVYPAAAGSTITTANITASFATSVMTVTATDAVLKVGQAITGAGVPANTYIASLGTGTGGNGTYNLTTAPGTVASASGIVASDYIETPFSILSASLAGELAKIGYGS